MQFTLKGAVTTSDGRTWLPAAGAELCAAYNAGEVQLDVKALEARGVLTVTPASGDAGGAAPPATSSDGPKLTKAMASTQAAELAAQAGLTDADFTAAPANGTGYTKAEVEAVVKAKAAAAAADG